MSAEETWHAQMEAGRRGDWDAMSVYFASDCTWTLMPPGTTFRGAIQHAKPAASIAEQTFCAIAASCEA